MGADDDRETGDCYYAAANALCMPAFAGGLSLPDDAVLVHGRPTLTRPPFEEYGHAWLEHGPMVIEVANGRRVAVPRETYYRSGKIDPVKCIRYSREQACDMLLKFKHFGPWEGPDACPPLDDFAEDEW